MMAPGAGAQQGLGRREQQGRRWNSRRGQEPEDLVARAAGPSRKASKHAEGPGCLEGTRPFTRTGEKTVTDSWGPGASGHVGLAAGQRSCAGSGPFLCGRPPRSRHRLTERAPAARCHAALRTADRTWPSDHCAVKGTAAVGRAGAGSVPSRPGEGSGGGGLPEPGGLAALPGARPEGRLRRGPPQAASNPRSRVLPQASG